MIVGEKFRIGRKIGAGNFGNIYLGKNIRTEEEVAIKIDRMPVSTTDTCSIADEYKFYKVLGKAKGIPKVHCFEKLDNRFVLVLELLGPSLDQLFERCKKRFSVRTVAMIALQITERLEYIHSKNIAYQDIKPDNFLIGNMTAKSSKGKDLIYCLDFGLSKFYASRATGHIPYSENTHLTGTARYMSIRAHAGTEQSRRDDLEALGYMYAYFLRGSLPWQGLPTDDCTSNRDRFSRISVVKQSVQIEDLFQSFPEEFVTYLAYVRGLKFTENPDYKYIRKLFTNVMAKNKWPVNWDFDWKRLPKEVLSISIQEEIHVAARFGKPPSNSIRFSISSNPLNRRSHSERERSLTPGRTASNSAGVRRSSVDRRSQLTNITAYAVHGVAAAPRRDKRLSVSETMRNTPHDHPLNKFKKYFCCCLLKDKRHSGKVAPSH